MARSRNSEGKTSSDRSTESLHPSAANSVGYGNPPTETRWHKGQSGNPRGRPRKAKKLPFSQKLDPIRDLIFEEMERTVDIKEGGQRIEIETARAIVRSVAIGAMKGDLRKQKLALQIATAAEQSSKAERAEGVKFVMFYKAKFDPIFRAAAKSGKAEPEELPHPDHVDIALTTGEMTITGPLMIPEKQQWDHLKFQLRETQKHLAVLVADAAAMPRNRSAAHRVALVQQHMCALLTKVPAGWNWEEELGWEEAYAERILALPKRN